MSFVMRTSCPNDNKYYIRKANGGWNGAIQGKPTRKGANVLANCVGYANGRFAEIQDKGKIEYQLICNAENFIESAKKQGLKVVNHPTLGGIMVWKKGSLSGNDGAGHVAVVEKIYSKEKIYTSESSYGGKYFYNATRTNTNGRWGTSSSYTFLGCIINPAIGDKGYDEGDEDMKTYKNGSTKEIVYADTKCTMKIGYLNPREKCDCYGIFKDRAIVRYKVDGTTNYKIGFCKWTGGVQ